MDEYSISILLQNVAYRKDSRVQSQDKTRNIELYLEIFEQFLVTNDGSSEKRLPASLTVIGTEVHEVLNNLVVLA